MKRVRGRRPGSIGGAPAGWAPSEAADRRWAVIRGRASPRGSADPGSSTERDPPARAPEHGGQRAADDMDEHEVDDHRARRPGPDPLGPAGGAPAVVEADQ